jgi:uncharacterized protein DUF3987
MRKLKDFIQGYMTFTEDQESPEVFHFWTAMTIMAGAIRRNVYLDRGFYKLFPNLYVIFVAESGKLRKSTAQEFGVDQILRKVPGVKLFTERMTMEGILQQMDSVQALPGLVMQKDGCVFIFAPELVMLLPGDEISRKVMGFMTSVYMGKDKYGVLTKGGGDVQLENVLINFLGATAPDWLESLSEDVAKGGFLARIVFVTADKRKRNIAWPEPTKKGITLDDLVHDLAHISVLRGEMQKTTALKEAFEEWYNEEKPSHDDPRVQGFREREHDLALRIAMLLSIANSDSLIIDKPHLIIAKNILKDVESFVPRALTHIATSPHSRDAERILNQIKRRGGKMTYTEILQANSWKMSATEVQEVIKSLEERDAITHSRSGRKITYTIGGNP